MKPRRTKKQIELMGHIMRAAGEEKFLTISELHGLLSYECSFGAVRVSVRFLEDKGMLVKQPEGSARLLVPTSLAYTWFVPGR